MRQHINDVVKIVNTADETKLTPMQRATSRIMTLLFIYAVVVLGSAEIFSITEGTPYWQSFYWANMTSTSVGYGDISPKVILGQLLAMFLANFSLLFLSPLITGRVAAQMIVDSDKFTHQEQEEMKAQQQEIYTMLLNITERLDAMDTKA